MYCSEKLYTKFTKIMKSYLVECCLLFVLVSSTEASIISLCGTADNYWEIHESQQDNTFTCTGLSAQDEVQWFLNDQSFSGGSLFLGSCPNVSANDILPACDKRFPEFTPRRISVNMSVMMVNTIGAPVVSLFEKERLSCTALSSTDGTSVTAGCRLDYIYSSENVSCTVQFRNDTWTMIGQCVIPKARSSQKRYRCQWINKQSFIESVVIANTSMLVEPFFGTYVNGSCNFTSYLPPNGLHTYHVTVVPGEVTVNASFIGSNQIRSPSSTPYHNCPQYISQGEGVTCECFVNDLGSPPGVVLWNTTRSPELRLTNVQVINNMTHVCQLFWNNTFVWSVEYVVNIGDSPRVLTFNMNNIDSKTVNVDENAHVEMRCNSDGKPSPNGRLVNVSNPFNLLNQSHTQEVSYYIDKVPCEASGIYRCDVNNSIGQDSQSCTLLVSCAPKRTKIDGNPPTVNVTNGSGVLTFIMTAYPTTEIKTLTYLGTHNSSNGHPVKESSIYAACSTTLLAPASVTCNVILINMTLNDEGLYRIVFSNSLGDLLFTFLVKVLEEDQQAGEITKTDEKIAGVVVLAVVLSIVVVLILVAVIWVWRRGWTLPCADVTNPGNTQQNQRSEDTSEHYLAPVTTNTLSPTQGRAIPLYDALQMKDVGKQSHYEGILPQHNASEISSYEDLSSNIRQTRNEPIYVN